jgi:hypothetical protein
MIKQMEKKEIEIEMLHRKNKTLESQVKILENNNKKMKKKGEMNVELLMTLEEENKMLKINSLKKNILDDDMLRKEVDKLEGEIINEMGNKTQEIKKFSKLLKKSKMETDKANKTIGEMNSKLKMRAEEINILEDKVMSLQNSIK